MFRITQTNFAKASLLAIFIDIQAKFSAFRGKYVWLLAEIFIPIGLLLLVDQTGRAQIVILTVFPATYIANYIISYSWRMRSNLGRGAFTPTQLIVGFHFFSFLLVGLIFLVFSISGNFSELALMLGALGFALCSPSIFFLSIAISRYKIEFADYKAFGSYMLLGVNFAVMPFADNLVLIAEAYGFYSFFLVTCIVLVLIMKPNELNFRLDFARMRTNQFVYTQYLSALSNCSSKEIRERYPDSTYKASEKWRVTMIAPFIIQRINDKCMPLFSPLPKDGVLDGLLEKNAPKLVLYRDIFKQMLLQPSQISWEGDPCQIVIEKCQLAQNLRNSSLTLNLNFGQVKFDKFKLSLFNSNRETIVSTTYSKYNPKPGAIKLEFPNKLPVSLVFLKFQTISNVDNLQVKAAHVARIQF